MRTRTQAQGRKQGRPASNRATRAGRKAHATKPRWPSKRCWTARQALTRKAIELAKAGDLVALRLCLDRICPPRKDRPVTFGLPKLETAADTKNAAAAVIAAVAEGELTPSEASELARLLDAFTRVLEASEFEERISRLEAKTNQ
jgi:hypothetical protein